MAWRDYIHPSWWAWYDRWQERRFWESIPLETKVGNPYVKREIDSGTKFGLSMRLTNEPGQVIEYNPVRERPRMDITGMIPRTYLDGRLETHGDAVKYTTPEGLVYLGKIKHDAYEGYIGVVLDVGTKHVMLKSTSIEALLANLDSWMKKEACVV